MSATQGLQTYNLRRPKAWMGAAAPTVDNDNSKGYGVGDQWTDYTNKRAYICVDATAGAAVWAATAVPKADAGAGVSDSAILVVEQGCEGYHKTTFTFSGYQLAITDHTTAGAHGSLKLYDFPEGVIRIFGVVVNLAIAGYKRGLTPAQTTGLTATAAVVMSLGTATAGIDNATLLTTEADVIPSTACSLTANAGAFVAINSAAITSLTDNSGGTASNTIAAQTGSYVQATQQNTIASLAAKINELIAGAVAGASYDGTATAKDLYLNAAVPDAGSADSGSDYLVITGTIQLAWANYGDK